MTSPDKLAPVSEERLLPCPFCGYAPTVDEGLCVVDQDEFGEPMEPVRYTGVCCAGCSAFIPINTADRGEAIAAWNHRTAPSTGEVTEEMVGRAMKAFINSLFDQDPHWTEDHDEGETLITEPSGRHYFALDFPIEAALRSALAAAPVASGAEAAPASVEVKPLMWREYASGDDGYLSLESVTILGTYEAWQMTSEGPYFWRAPRDRKHRVGSLAEAKAVAQADYEARIRSALVNGGTHD